MPATETVFLKHTFLNKASQARPYTARAHSRYIARRSATQYHHVENMPLNYQARQRWYHDMEKGLRKNGRVIDKFTLSIPKDVSLDHAASVITRLGKELGERRAPFEFSLQGWGTTNHHSHIIYVDRDPETGRRIFGTTDRNSTRDIKLEWERVANEAFEELGYDVRVKVKEGWHEAEEMEAPEEVGVVEVEPLSTDAELDPEPESAEADEEFDGDDEMAIENLTPAERIQAAREAWENHRYFQQGIAERDEAVRQYEYFRELAQGAALSAATETSVVMHKEQSLHNARSGVEATHRADGRAKGIRLGLFGRTFWESPARRAANEAHARFRDAQSVYERAVKDLEEITHTSARLSNQATEMKAKAEALTRHVRVLGTDEQIAKASEDQLAKIGRYIGEMATEELVVMVEEGEISSDECAEMLRVMGRKADLEIFLEAEEIREGQGQSL